MHKSIAVTPSHASPPAFRSRHVGMGAARLPWGSFAEGGQPKSARSSKKANARCSFPLWLLRTLDPPPLTALLKRWPRASPGDHQQPESLPPCCTVRRGAGMLQEDLFFAAGRMRSNCTYGFPCSPKMSHKHSFSCLTAASFRGSFNGPIKNHPYVRQSPGAADTEGEAPYLALPGYISS